MNSLHEFDVAAFRFINGDLHYAWLDPFFAFFSYFGLGGVIGASCLLFLVSKATRHFVLPLLLADAISGFLVADGLKSLIVRDRPSKMPWALVQEPIYHSSFPSGHTTTAFAIWTMLVFLTWSTPYRKLGWFAGLVAVLIGFSRIYRGVHWPTDVLAGAMLGIATSCLLYLVLPRFRIRI